VTSDPKENNMVGSREVPSNEEWGQLTARGQVPSDEEWHQLIARVGELPADSPVRLRLEQLGWLKRNDLTSAEVAEVWRWLEEERLWLDEERRWHEEEHGAQHDPGSTTVGDGMSSRPEMPSTRRYLVVANRTSGGTGLAGMIRARAMEGGALHVVVPTHRDGVDNGVADAQRRMLETVARIRGQGCEVTGSVATAEPVEAIRDELSEDRYEGIIMSTPPAGMSRLFHKDLPHKVEREFEMPIEWVESRTDDPDEPTTPQIALPW
jgi:hypothetical protein